MNMVLPLLFLKRNNQNKKHRKLSKSQDARALETKTTAWLGCWMLNNSVSQTRGQFIFFIFRLSCYAQLEVAVAVETNQTK